jgi:hypothetical protein
MGMNYCCVVERITSLGIASILIVWLAICLCVPRYEKTEK